MPSARAPDRGRAGHAHGAVDRASSRFSVPAAALGKWVRQQSRTVRQEDTPRPLEGKTRQPHRPTPSANLEYDAVDLARRS